jgi:hypothetical protein
MLEYLARNDYVKTRGLDAFPAVRVGKNNVDVWTFRGVCTDVLPRRSIEDLSIAAVDV